MNNPQNILCNKYIRPSVLAFLKYFKYNSFVRHRKKLRLSITIDRLWIWIPFSWFNKKFFSPVATYIYTFSFPICKINLFFSFPLFFLTFLARWKILYVHYINEEKVFIFLFPHRMCFTEAFFFILCIIFFICRTLLLFLCLQFFSLCSKEIYDENLVTLIFFKINLIVKYLFV